MAAETSGAGRTLLATRSAPSPSAAVALCSTREHTRRGALGGRATVSERVSNTTLDADILVGQRADFGLDHNSSALLHMSLTRSAANSRQVLTFMGPYYDIDYDRRERGAAGVV